MEDLKRHARVWIILSLCTWPVIGWSSNGPDHWSQSSRDEQRIALTGELADREGNYSIQARTSELPVPKSRWLEAEKAFYLNRAKTYETEIVVLPPQVDATPFSEPVRALMGAMLNDRLLKHRKNSSRQQFDLVKAFGGARDIPLWDIRAIAEATSASVIYEPYVGYIDYISPRKEPSLALTLRLHTKVGGNWETEIVPSIFVPMPFGASPFDVFEQALSELPAKVGLRPRLKPKRVKQNNQKRLFDVSLEDLDRASDLDQAIYLQLLGSTTPRVNEKLRQEFFARSLYLLLGLDNKNGVLNGLLARAYHELEMHAFALSLVEGDSKGACFGEYMRANLTLLVDCYEAQSGIQQALSSLDLLNLAKSFDIKSSVHEARVFEAFEGMGDWFSYVHSFVQSDALFQSDESTWLKAEFDHHFPIDTYTEQHIRLDPLVGRDQEGAMRLAAIRHFKRVRRDHDEFLPATDFVVDEDDRLRYMLAHTLEHVYREGRKIILVQALGQRGMAYVNTFEAQLEGHPMLAYLKGAAYKQVAETGSPDESRYHFEQAYEYGARAYHWEQESTFISSQAFRVVSSIRKPYLPRFTGYLGGGYPHGLPGKFRKGKGSLNHNPLSFERFKEEVKVKLDTNQPLAELEHRFQGHPARELALIEPYMARRQWDKARPLAESQLANFPERYKNYSTLANILLRLGEFDEAAEVYHGYPPFNTIETEDRVEHSNYAASTAVRFQIVGRHDLARPFLELAEQYRSGSALNIASLQSLEFARGNVEGAMYYARYNLERYGHPDALQSYFVPLAAMGYEEDVLTIFDNYVVDQKSMISWLPAHSAQRALGWNTQQIIDWLQRDHLQGIRSPYQARLNHYVREVTTDRAAAPLDYEFIRSEAPLGFLSDHFMIQKLEPEAVKGKKPGDPITMDSPEGVATQGWVWPKEIEQYLELNYLFKSKQFKKAYEEMASYRKHYAWREHSILLLAQIYVENNDLEGLEKLIRIAAFSPKDPMPAQLAIALLSASKGDHETALRKIQEAMGYAIGTGDRFAFTPYLTATAVYYLWQKTGRVEYRTKALDWARSNQLTHPYHAWPYALAALLSEVNEERVVAAQHALHLDRQSYWLQLVPENVRSEASLRLDAVNPFLPKPTEETQESKS